MTECQDDNAFTHAMQILIDEGFGSIAECITILMNEAMVLERQKYLNANGFKSKSILTRMGALNLRVPQTRDSGFYPSSLEKGIRSERALKLALAEMYVQGVSTRRVAKITEELCGFEVTSTQVSRAASELDRVLDEWRERPLNRAYPYLYLDARYEKVRQGGHVVDCAVLVALAVDDLGHREILGTSVALSEQEAHWRGFLSHLMQRGLHGVTLIISDAHEGLKAARRAVFPSIPWQRCQFHLQQNAQSYIPSQKLKRSVASEIRSIFNAPDGNEAKRLLDKFIEGHCQNAPKLSKWAESALPEGFTFFEFPDDHRKRIRTSNVLERVNEEVKRRTRVARIFPNEKSCLRLVTAVLMEISEEWQSGKRYLKITT